MLEGKRILVTGVVTHRSIAWTVAEQAQIAGAEVLLTGFGRGKRMTERAAGRLPDPPDVLELDVNSQDDLDALGRELDERWGRVDGALHAIAFAPEDALGGNFLEAPPASAAAAFQTSAYSLKALAAALRPLMQPGSGIVALDFDASVAWPVYDWMGVAKAALEAVGRYLARDLGPDGVRVNLVSAGPLQTPAASGIPGFEKLAGAWQRQAPLGWDVRDPGPVASAVCFLLSDHARGAWQRQAPLGWDVRDPGPVASAVCFLLSDHARAITGEILHVDGGFHAIGAVDLPSDEEAADAAGQETAATRGA